MVLKRQTYQENIDLICEIDGQQWEMVEAIVQLSQDAGSDYVDFIAIPSEETKKNFPDNPTDTSTGLLGSKFTLDVVNDIRTKGVKGKKRIFTGNLANLSPSVDAGWEGIAYDPTFETFEKGSSLMSQRIDIERALLPFEEAPQNDPLSYYIKASKLIEVIIEKANIGPIGENAFIHMKEDGYPQGKDGEGDDGGIDLKLKFDSYEDKPVKDLLDRLEKSTNSTYWVDRGGNFHFGALRPTIPINTYELQFIIDSSAGLTTPSYNSVRVIGSGVVSEDGWRKSGLIESGAIKLSEKVEDDELDEGLKEPTFTYKNMQIQTQKEANSVRQKIADNLAKQSKSGKITVTGFPEIRPLDVVKMPNNNVQPFGGEVYGVYKVKHKFGAGDGFKTDIHVEGLTSAQFGYQAADISKKYPFLELSENELLQNLEDSGLDSIGTGYTTGDDTDYTNDDSETTDTVGRGG